MRCQISRRIFIVLFYVPCHIFFDLGGICDVHAALTAAQYGANFIGMIFIEASPRCVKLENAKAITQAMYRFGERSKRHVFSSFPPSTFHENALSSPRDKLPYVRQWFQEFARQLSQTSARMPLVVGNI
jgi:phosphoribosylanthranilate isomerase